MKKFNGIDWLTLILLIIGGINWGLIGFFNTNLVGSLFGDMSTVSRVIYATVGLSALYMLFATNKLMRGHEPRETTYRETERVEGRRI